MSTASYETVGIIVLAAGASSRLGSPKQLLKFEGKSLVRRAAEAALGSHCGEVVVVLGSGAAEVGSELDGLELKRVVNTEWASGMGSSVRCGMALLRPETEAVIIMLCDQPFVTSGVLNRLAAAYVGNGAQIAASEYAGSAGVPALFSSRYFKDLKELPADQGAKKILTANTGDTFRIPFPEGSVDIDTAADARRLDLTLSEP